MLGRAASVAFTADTAGYTQSLTQAIAVTNQYSKAADTMLGTLAKIGGSMSAALINRTAALTQANKVATAQAAAYQQQLSKLESTSKVLGDKTFPALRKSTMALSTAFPISIGQAVEQMQALQESGVTSVKQMDQLSKTFTKLGAGTNSFGPAIGTQMVELTRSMGNTLSMSDGMADSLTTLTKKFGGTAQGILAFSKTIAPIAATVGMNQTQVMGLSTAFARLGEDGLAAGNALNKVLLDLNRSVRDGTPELREYANVMNKDVTTLRKQFENDPTSVLVDFTTAINKSGPDATRILETLGLEGVRTAKALTSLSREGNLGEIVKTASESFGSGASAKAAETAMGGVNDQITRLNETMSQMVAGAGRPFLGFMESVLGVSNKIASSFNSVINSEFMQKVGGAGQVGGAVAGGIGSFALNAVNTAMLAGLAVRGGRAISGQFTKFSAGRNAAIAEANGISVFAPPQGLAGAAGSAYARGLGLTDMAIIGSSGAGLTGFLKGAGAGLKRGLNDTKALAAFLAMSAANDQRTAWGMSKIPTEAGTKLAVAKAEAGVLFRGGDFGGAAKTMGAALKEAELSASKATKAFGGLSGSLVALAQATAMTYGKIGKGLLGLLTLGTGTTGLAVAGVGVAAYGVYAHNKSLEKQRDAISAGISDPYRSFNEFAEKAGYATMAISALGDAAEQTAKEILSGDNATMSQAYQISAKEKELAADSGYTAAFKTSGNAREDALRATLMNPSMSPEATSRLITDVLSQNNSSYTAQFTDALKSNRSSFEQDPVKFAAEAIKSATSMTDGGFGGFWKQLTGQASNKELDIKQQVSEAFTQQYEQDKQTGGSDYANRQRNANVQKLFEYAASPEGAASSGDIIQFIAQQLGTDEKSVRAAMGGSGKATYASGNSYAGSNGTTVSAGVSTAGNFDRLMAGLGDVNSPLAEMSSKAWQAQKSGKPVASAEESAVYKAYREGDKSIGKLTGVNIHLADVMMEANSLAAENNVNVRDLTKAQMDSLSSAGAAVGRALKAPGDTAAVMDAGRVVAKEVISRSGDSLWKSQAALIQKLASAPNDGSRSVIGAALSQLTNTMRGAKIQVNQSPMERIRGAISLGNAMESVKIDDSSSEEFKQAREQAITDRANAYKEFAQIQRQVATQVRDTLISMDRAETDFGISRARSQRDFNRQAAWAEKDNAHQRWINQRNFNQQMRWSDADHDREVSRARADFRLSMSRSEDDFQRSMLRSTQDYNKSRRRSSDDFNKSMRRAEQDFYTSRGRAIADHDKALARQIEDSAKTLYDPYERVMHQRVWDTRQLLSNVGEQNAVLTKQMQQVEDLKKRGLSQQSIDLFGLADPEKAQQTLRIYGEMLNNADLITQMNDTSAARAGVSQQVTTSDNNVSFRRQEEDFKTSLARSGEDFKKQVTRSSEDFTLSMERSAEDFHVAMTRNREDFARSTSRAWDDFNKSMRRGNADYERSVDRSRLQFRQSMSENDYQFRTQMSRQRLQFQTSLSDAAADFGRSRSRMLADLRRGMTDMSATNTSLINAATAFINSMPAKYREPMRKAFSAVINGINSEIETSNKKRPPITAKFKYYNPWTGKFETGGPIKVQINNETEDARFKYYNPSTGKYEYGGKIKAEVGAQTVDNSGNKVEGLRFKYYNPATGKYEYGGNIKVKIKPTIDTSSPSWKKFERQMRAIYGGGSVEEGPGDEPRQEIHGQGVTRWTHGDGRAGAGWYQRGNWTWRGGHHNGVDVVGVKTGHGVYTTKSGKIVHSGWGGPEGGWAGKNVIQDIGGGVRLVFAHLSATHRSEGDHASAGSKVGAVGNTGRSFGAHLHVSAIKGGTYVDPRKYLAEGGIAQRETNAKIAEAGYPEAVIPLNERGVSYLVSAMAKYASNTDAKMSRVAPYATKVVVNNYAYDHSTRINGPITVQSNDPDDFAKKMQAKQRRNALLQPVGSKR